MTVTQIIKELKNLGNPQALEGMSRYGINTSKAFGISMPLLRKLAKHIGKNHQLALDLWETGYHEARMLAAMIDDPSLVTKAQMNNWASAFNSWDLCDQCCQNLFVYTKHAHSKAEEWSKVEKEFIKRAGFTLMASLSVHDKGARDKEFIKFFPLIKKESYDERNYVKKAVNWALRQIGKRNESLNKEALKLCEEIVQLDSKSAKWIAKDAIRELTNPKIRNRIK